MLLRRITKRSRWKKRPINPFRSRLRRRPFPQSRFLYRRCRTIRTVLSQEGLDAVPPFIRMQSARKRAAISLLDRMKNRHTGRKIVGKRLMIKKNRRRSFFSLPSPAKRPIAAVGNSGLFICQSGGQKADDRHSLSIAIKSRPIGRPFIISFLNLCPVFYFFLFQSLPNGDLLH